MPICLGHILVQPTVLAPHLGIEQGRPVSHLSAHCKNPLNLLAYDGVSWYAAIWVESIVSAVSLVAWFMPNVTAHRLSHSLQSYMFPKNVVCMLICCLFFSE